MDSSPDSSKPGDCLFTKPCDGRCRPSLPPAPLYMRRDAVRKGVSNVNHFKGLYCLLCPQPNMWPFLAHPGRTFLLW